MAKRLTEEMVIARTKISDLSKIKRLNCWGSELVDVSLLRRIPNVEVLSLSINKIDTLVDFQFCKRLEELYIRQNDIRNLHEVVYLQNLTNLKNLWLGENPCCNTDGYRLAVIKALPQLQKLDNVAITQEELRDSQRRGKALCHPEDAHEESEEEYVAESPPQQHPRYQEYPEPEYSPVQRGSPRQEQSPQRRPEQRRSYSPDEQCVERRRNSFDREAPRQPATQYYDTSSSATNSFEEPKSCDSQNTYREAKIVTSQSASCIKEYTNGDRYIQTQQYKESSEVSSTHGLDKRYSCSAAVHRPPFTRRPVTRNSNILSAVLCLVKELDYPSLEVVEMAVRCRMDELDE
ncbi:acidic leucine-rich nuclear phosphoprotein 32 family member A-like isoform X2 [Dendroctonus ponderosae]|uniref:acidic leucine-rich nuclear phosphoprotein 32 family member A-like isoform X2 n=1 Tax=Dendroctonus ponderosae TaxID=77166 RepID=UPI002035EEF4|nr:acidic leucine-rich nuclear phosphoprotein 32 family member A-like isoform X2 [Dendroctonus ponderosae]